MLFLFLVYAHPLWILRSVFDSVAQNPGLGASYLPEPFGGFIDTVALRGQEHQERIRVWSQQVGLTRHPFSQYQTSSMSNDAHGLSPVDYNQVLEDEEYRRLQLEDESDDDGEIIITALITMIVNVIMYTVLTLIFATMYKSRVTAKRPPFPTNVGTGGLNQGKWAMGCDMCGVQWPIFFQDWYYCLLGCCCAGATYGDRWETAGVKPFMTVVFVLLGFYWVSQAFNCGVQIVRGLLEIDIMLFDNMGGLIVSLWFALWLARRRGELRKKLGDNVDRLWLDFCCMWCCVHCLAVQEAHQVDLVQGVRVQICCQLVGGSGGVGVKPNVVGQPVAVAQPVAVGQAVAAV